MKRLITFTLLTVFLVVGTASPVTAADKLPASGTFTAMVDFASFTFTPVGVNCLLEVNGQLDFIGTLEGTAAGTTRALVLAPCEEVADFENNPPGTFKDVFKSELVFTGTVDGTPATAEMTYQGITEASGNIEAHILLKNGLKGNLDVEAVVIIGGSYEGFVRLP
jgi:hypothetical protein